MAQAADRRRGLATDDVERLDLKIATAALTEMRDAFRVFAPYHDVPKVTIFGSARTRPDDPVTTRPAGSPPTWLAGGG